jgi:hypothetical protein
MIALNITPDLDIPEIKQVLAHGEDEGWWSYEEGCVGGAWVQ